jgi:hypothetical protein
MTTTLKPGFYANDVEVFRVSESGRIWLVASPDAERLEEIDRENFPADATPCDSLLTGEELADYDRQVKEMEGDTTLSLEEQVRTLSTLTTRTNGVHFTERYSDDVLDRLEQLGLITIDRPIHEPTGIPWDRQYWSVEVTEDGVELVQANPEYWDVDNA